MQHFKPGMQKRYHLGQEQVYDRSAFSFKMSKSPLLSPPLPNPPGLGFGSGLCNIVNLQTILLADANVFVLFPV